MGASEPISPVSASAENEALGRGGHRSAWHFAPCIGIWQGMINPVLVSVPTILLKSMGVSNTVIGFASIATLPMALKFMFGPMVDAKRTRRWWILRSGEALMLCLLLLAATLLPAQFSLWLFLGAMTLLAVAKAIQQVALQGFFTLALTRSELALFSGLDPVFARLSGVLTASILLSLAGIVGAKFGDTRITWAVYFGVLIALFAVLYFYTRRFFPRPAADRPKENKQEPAASLKEIVRGYFTLPSIWAGLGYLFFMRSGETFLAKMGPAFLMDAKSQGGFGLSIAEVGLFTGVMNGCAIAGGAISGLLLKRHGLRKIIWPFTLAAVVPNFIYVVLAWNNESGVTVVSLDMAFFGGGVWRLDWALLLLLGLENLGFGLGFTVMNYYMFRMAAGTRYPASYVAFSASAIYLSFLIFGTISGMVQEAVGYAGLFVLSILVSAPAFAVIPFLNYELDRREA